MRWGTWRGGRCCLWGARFSDIVTGGPSTCASKAISPWRPSTGIARAKSTSLVGFIAHAFCADWTRSGYAQAPTLEEARAFVASYEAARAASFERDERFLCGAAFAYSVGYTSRCGHAFGKRERDLPGTFHHLLASQGESLLRL